MFLFFMFYWKLYLQQERCQKYKVILNVIAENFISLVQLNGY